MSTWPTPKTLLHPVCFLGDSDLQETRKWLDALASPSLETAVRANARRGELTVPSRSTIRSAP
jgi:hypothetical protein